MAIARAIASKPRIVLFDEATSALDNRTQAIVIDSLSKLKATRIVIAHRLSTIVKADRIYVLRSGRIVQSGTYAELMDREVRSGIWPSGRSPDGMSQPIDERRRRVRCPSSSALSPGCSPTLISPTAFSTMAAVAGLLPGSLATTRSASSVGSPTIPSGGLLVLAPRPAGTAWPGPTRRPRCPPGCRRIRSGAACRLWPLAGRIPRPGLEQAVDGLWMEFDLDGAPPENPRPSAFLGLSADDEGAAPDG